MNSFLGRCAGLALGALLTVCNGMNHCAREWSYTGKRQTGRTTSRSFSN